MPRWDEAFEMATSSSAPPGWGLQMPLELHGGFGGFFAPPGTKKTCLALTQQQSCWEALNQLRGGTAPDLPLPSLQHPYLVHN